MKRRESDRGAREILKSFDRWAEEFPDQPPALCGFMTIVAGTAVERFAVPGGWSVDGIRSVLLALCLNAPAADLERMRVAARKERADLEASDLDASLKSEERAQRRAVVGSVAMEAA